MARKPANLQYGVDDVPPASVVVVNALQYVAVLAAFLVYPLIMAREAHAPREVIDSVLSWSMIILAVGTALQALRKGPLGSGLLAPSTMTAVYVPPSLEAVRLGGLPLMAGMTVFGFHGGSHCGDGHAETLRKAGADLTFADMHQLPELVQRNVGMAELRS